MGTPRRGHKRSSASYQNSKPRTALLRAEELQAYLHVLLRMRGNPLPSRVSTCAYSARNKPPKPMQFYSLAAAAQRSPTQHRDKQVASPASPMVPPHLRRLSVNFVIDRKLNSILSKNLAIYDHTVSYQRDRHF
jgi:hypothetical protein